MAQFLVSQSSLRVEVAGRMEQSLSQGDPFTLPPLSVLSPPHQPSPLCPSLQLPSPDQILAACFCD